MSSSGRRASGTAPERRSSGRTDTGALEAISAAVESGSGLPEVVRAAGRALDASIVLIDRSSAVLAVAARSPADERSLLAGGADVETVELRVADDVVGHLRIRVRAQPPDAALLRLITTLVGSEVQRVRAPERASEAAASGFLHAILSRELTDRDDLIARGKELGVDLELGAGIVVARAHPLVPTDDDWRARVLTVAERGARPAAPGAVAALSDRDDGIAGVAVVLVPDPDEAVVQRVAELVLRELEAGLQGFSFTVGHSRVARDPVDLHRAGNEALLAANVADAQGREPLLSFDATGAYRLLLPAMSEHPDELQRFYAETLEPLVVYDEQYETELVQTLETFLDSDGNVAQTAQKLFTHRHTIRYRLERVRELSGLDVGSSDGREKLSLGLKAMRVLGISAPRGPATEEGAEAGRVPRVGKDRR